MSEPFIGEIILFGGTFAPRGWALCQGQLLAVSQNQALFSLLGTTYGGDGRTTFGLPDLRGRVIVGEGTGPGLAQYQLGARGGVETVALTSSQMPSHGHTVATTVSLAADTGEADQHEPSSTRVLAAPTIQGAAGVPLYSSAAPDRAIEGAEVSGNLAFANAGGSQAHTNLQPFLSLHYIIALVGIFPPRN